MKIALSGASGFIGSSLKNYFIANQFEFAVINRSDSIDTIAGKINSADAVINLSGAPILKRWTRSYKNTIINSRKDITGKIVQAFSRTKIKPGVFISASAIGIYDSDNIHNETSVELSNSFLAGVCRIWEQEALQAEKYQVRTVITRFAIVLGKNGGAFPAMIKPFRFGLGGKIGNGKQAISFIHIDDVIEAINFIMFNKSITGIVNFSAPEYYDNATFTKELAALLKRPAFFNIPEFLLKLIYGESASVITDGQKVIPAKLLESGFVFKYPDIRSALKSLI